nr:beta-glycosidase [eukaryotic synthetic construct]
MMVAWWSLFLYGLQVAAPALAAGAVTYPGAIPLSLTSNYETPSPTAIPLEPTPTATGTAELDALWNLVEAQYPVQTAAVTTLVTVPDDYKFEADPPSYALAGYETSEIAGLKFPKGFKFGVAGAAIQVEGAAKAEGRGPSTWDYLCHHYASTQCNNYDPDITTNHYYLYPLDFARLQHLGINTYSFSISWTRIYPLGAGYVNEAGLAHYDAVIHSAKKYGLEPVGTVFHWDTPLSLMLKYGAWQDTGDQIVKDFVTYATTVFKRYGNEVKTWFTFNEPRVFCSQNSGLPYNLTYPEGINSTSAVFRCTYNVLKAHGHAVKVYRDLVASGTIAAGEIGFKSDDNYPIPARPGNADDEESAKRHEAFRIGIFAQPVYGNGDYPDVVKETVGDMLPALTDEDKGYIKGSGDIFAIDGYRTDISHAALNGIANCIRNQSDPNWPVCEEGSDPFAHVYPSGFAIGQSADPLSSWLVNSAPFIRDQLKFLTQTYPAKGGIYFSEFGWAEDAEYDRQLLYQITWDGLRTQYLTDYLSQLLLAVHKDGINLRGALTWSFVDNWEWGLGMQQKFGFQFVNQSDPDLTRTFKLSAHAYAQFGRNHL